MRIELNTDKKHINSAAVNKYYQAPSISVTVIAMESAFAAGSTVNIKIEDNNTPYIVEWEERQSEQTWNF